MLGSGEEGCGCGARARAEEDVGRPSWSEKECKTGVWVVDGVAVEDGELVSLGLRRDGGAMARAGGGEGEIDVEAFVG